MTEQIDPISLIDNAPARRLWLLLEAVRSLPFDRAVELARIAEGFITGSVASATTHQAVSPSMTRSKNPEQPKEIRDEPRTNAAILADRPTKHGGLALSDDDRDRLLDGLAKDARNEELAAEFGISRKQVQGMRMGCAREIATRRARLAEKPSDQSQEDQDPAASASIDEVVRYLRQQDDVVVPQENGGYIVNGRFRLSAAELVARANRIRSRQRMPSFQMRGADIQLAPGPATNSPPVFWETTPAATRHKRVHDTEPTNKDGGALLSRSTALGYSDC